MCISITTNEYASSEGRKIAALCLEEKKRKKLCREHQQYNSSSSSEIKIFKSRSKYFESRSTQEIFSLQSQKLLCVIAFQMFVKCSLSVFSAACATSLLTLFTLTKKKKIFVSIMWMSLIHIYRIQWAEATHTTI